MATSGYTSGHVCLDGRVRARPMSALALFLMLAAGASCLPKVLAQSAPSSASAAGAQPTSGDRSATQPKVVALIEAPVVAMSPELQPLQAGLAHLLLSDLAGHPQVRAVSREKVSALLEETQLGGAGLVGQDTAQRVGNAVQADVVLALKVSGSPAKLVATVQLLKSAGGEPAWSQDFPGQGSDLPGLERRMLSSLRERLGLAESQAGQAPKGQPATLAVFDFQPGGPVAELDKYGSDLADLLASDLSAYETVRLVERQRLAVVLQEQALVLTQRSAQDQARLGRLLGAQRLLYTTMVQGGQNVRFDSQLVEPQTGMIVTAASVEGPAQQAAALLHELAGQIAARLSVSGKAPEPSAGDAAGALPLEAAIHLTRGAKLYRLPDYDKAIPELQQAAFLAPDVMWAWKLLAEACLYDKRYDDAVRYVTSFLARHPELGGELRPIHADAQEARGNWSGLEAAAHAWLNDPPSTVGMWRETQAAHWLSLALIKQGRVEEAVRYCESLTGHADDRNIVGAWGALIPNLMNSGKWWVPPGAEGPQPNALSVVRRELAALPVGPEAEQRAVRWLTWPVLMHCLIASAVPGSHLYDLPARDLAPGLEVLDSVIAKFKDGTRIPAAAGLARALLLARMNRPADALAALHSVLKDFPTADVDGLDSTPLSPPANGTVHFYIGVINEHLGRRAEAAAAYRKAVAILGSDLPLGQAALTRLKEWKTPPPPEAAWEKRVQAFPPFTWSAHNRRFVHWLRTHGHQLWEAGSANKDPLIGSSGTLVLIYGGRQPSMPSADDLRAWVVHGGRLLLLCQQLNEFMYAPDSPQSGRATLDQTLNWILPAFGMRMDPAALWTLSQDQPVTPAERAPVPGLESFAYTGEWSPMTCPDEAVVLRLAGEAGQPASAHTSGAVVAAARDFGLGRVAVVTLRDWFPAMAWPDRPAPWDERLLARVMAWLTEPQRDPAKSKLVERFARAWEARMADYPNGGFREFEALMRQPGPWGEEARYIVAQMRTGGGGSGAGNAAAALPMFAELARSARDPWLRRMSALWAGRLATWRDNPAQALDYYRMAAAEQRDYLWASAIIGQADVAVHQGDLHQAEARFREVANTIGHSSERIRALYGLGYSLEHQGRKAEAARLYQAIADEYGEVQLPPFLEPLWADPRNLYWPQVSGAKP